MSFTTLIGSIELGLVFAILSMGLYVTFRILDLPDLTVDGSFVTGVAYSALWAKAGIPLAGIFYGSLAAMLAGVFTGILHTKLKIHAILAGILTMTGLYSINLMIMQDKPSIFFYGEKTIFSFFEGKIKVNGTDIGKLILLLIIITLIIIFLKLFLLTRLGLSLRATGDNEAMVRSSSINTDLMKILGFALCNLLVGLSGAIYAQYSNTANIGIGTGMLVLGLASIIIGETVIGRHGILRQLIAVVVGAVLYRLLLTKAFDLGLPAGNIKLFSALIVIVAISIPMIKPAFLKWRKVYVGNK